ncbi:cobalamin biosynthesis protein CobG, partial [Streptomyces fuscigenes]|nr:cobalamin biosynthesis protein CobG [Streptomyces fuscigenes]
PGGDRAAVCVLPPPGRLSTAQWRLLAAAGEGLRVTPWRGLVVPGLTPSAADALLAGAAAAGLVTTPDSPWTRVGSCTGRPGCAKALADVRADAAAFVAAHAQEDPATASRALPVHFSGCSRRCGHPQGPYVDAVATADGTYTTTTTGAATGTAAGSTTHTATTATAATAATAATTASAATTVTTATTATTVTR